MKKSFLCFLILCLSTCLTACSLESAGSESAGLGDGQNPTVTDSPQDQEWVYVPERIPIPDPAADYERLQLCGDTVCYITANQMEGSEGKYICKYSLTERELQKIPIAWEDDGAIHEACCYTFDAEGNAWLVVTAYSRDYTDSKRFLYRFDVDGKVLFCRDVTEQLLKPTGWITNVAVDGQNRIYVFDRQNGVWLYDASGTFCGNVPYENHRDVQDFGAVGTSDGRLLVCLKKESNASSCTLSEVRFEEKKIVDVVKEFPLVRGMCPGEGGDFWMYDETLVYAYSLDRQEAKVLFPWSDGEINGYYACGLSGMQDGGIFCAVNDHTSDDRNVVLLTRCEAKDAPNRIPLVLAMVSDVDDLDEQLSGRRVGVVMKQSRNSSDYHITVKKYDSLESLYLAFLRGENIDLIDLSGMRKGVNVDNLCRQGVFADLSPYLKQSGRLSEDSFVDGILNAYSYDGRLIGIPDTFVLRTLAGDLGLLKDKDGLTLSEFYDISKNIGEKALVESYAGVSKEEMLQYLLLFNEELFIDWEKKECHFDSAEFRKVLELAALFPEQADYVTEDGVPKWQVIEKGGAVFAMADLSYPKAFQAYEHAYGENAALVGFPTPDGNGGSLLLAGDAFGITANSRYPDEAWKFMEDFLCQQTLDGADPEKVYQSYANMVSSRFPARKDVLKYMVDYRIEQDRLEESKTGVGLSNWEPGYHSLTMEEVNTMMELLPHARPYRSAEGDVVLKIISEEAGAYYSGQKTIEEVAGIIQNRVQVYVNEQDY